jgi:8-oxo-dGTP pyrophosphatase MutT (NUDIX family)
MLPPQLEVQVSGIVMRKGSDGYEVLVAKRTAARRRFPKFWECGGGRVAPGEIFSDAVKRQLREELSIEVEIVCLINEFYTPAPDLPQQVIPGVRFLCEFKSFLNGSDVEIDTNEFTEARWVPVEEIEMVELIPGLQEDIEYAAVRFEELKG